MSYSRWSNSRWYTFYTAFSGNTKNSQALEIMIDFARSKIFTYEELKSDIDGCLDEIRNLCETPTEYSSPEEILRESNIIVEPVDVRSFYDNFIYVTKVSPPDPATKEELDELRIYMKNFICDVEWDYSTFGKFSDYLIGANVRMISRFGWWLKRMIQPKREKYAGRSREVR